MNFLKKLFKKKNYNLTISAKVYRAETGKIEDLGVISKGNVKIYVNGSV